MRSASVQLSVDTAVTLLDLEETAVSPRGTPGVSTEPVVKLGGGIMTISDHLDGEASSLTTSLVIVNTALVVEEVLVDSYTSLHWTVVVKLGLDGID